MHRMETTSALAAMEMIADEEILAKAAPTLCRDEKLQLAHDKMLLSTASPGSEEYGRLWKEYLAAGGNRTMIEPGIDNENWRRFR